MATFNISIKLYNAGYNDCSSLETAMEKENFILVKPVAFEERQFVYYGNLSLLHINSTVEKVIASTGRACSFTATKDTRTEQQYHKDVRSMYRQTA